MSVPTCLVYFHSVVFLLLPLFARFCLFHAAGAPSLVGEHARVNLTRFGASTVGRCARWSDKGSPTRLCPGVDDQICRFCSRRLHWSRLVEWGSHVNFVESVVRVSAEIYIQSLQTRWIDLPASFVYQTSHRRRYQPVEVVCLSVCRSSLNTGRHRLPNRRHAVCVCVSATLVSAAKVMRRIQCSL